MNLKNPSDIPSNWPVLLARKTSRVLIRSSKGIETFKVSWQDSELTSDPEKDWIIIQPDGSEYPCKKDIFADTYVEAEKNLWAKKELSKLVQVPEGESIQIETLEGTLNAIKYPDYIAIGKQNELYANTKIWADRNLEFIA